MSNNNNSKTTSSLLGEQFLSSSSQMLEKLRLAVSVLRNQPNRWFTLTQLDQEIGCGYLLVKFPMSWREFILENCSSDSASSIKCRYTLMAPKQKNNQNNHKNEAATDLQNKSKINKPLNANYFQLQYTAPFFRDPKELMKQLKHLYFARGGGVGADDFKNNNITTDAAQNDQKQRQQLLRCLPVDCLAVGAVRQQSLHVIQQSIDKDWLYVVQAIKPSKKAIMMSNNNRSDDVAMDDENNDETGQQQQLPRRRQRERKDEENDDGAGGRRGGGGGKSGGGGGGGGGGDEENKNSSSGTDMILLSSASLTEMALVGGRGLCTSLYQNHKIEIFISTRVLGALVNYPVGRFLGDTLLIPSTGSQLLNPTSSNTNNKQDAILDQLKKLQDGFWDINLSREFDIDGDGSGGGANVKTREEKRISLVCDPPGSCFVFPSQLICSCPSHNNNNNNQTVAWRGSFRIVPLKEGKIEFKLSVHELSSSSSSSSSKPTSHNNNQIQQHDKQKQSTFSSRVQVKKRFPVDDQSLYKTPPLLFYRGIGSVSILSALGMSDVTTTKKVNETKHQQKGAEQDSQKNSLFNDGRVVANSVKRMLEPVPMIMQSIAAGAVVDFGSSSAAIKLREEDLKFAENFCFVSTNSGNVNNISSSSYNFNKSNSTSMLTTTSLETLALEREARLKAREKQIQDILHGNNNANENSTKKKNIKNTSNPFFGGSREMKFSNAHMLHLGIDTRKPYFSANGGKGGNNNNNDDDANDDASYPLESMDF